MGKQSASGSTYTRATKSIGTFDLTSIQMDTGKKVASSIPEAGVDRKTNQIFIRNLSYDVTSDDLLKIFEEHGPVKNVSVVLEGGVSRGFGFVKL